MPNPNQLTTRRAQPTDDDYEVRKIEIEFAVPVYLRDTDSRDLYDLIDKLVDRPVNQFTDGIHWLAEHGHKPKWSVADCQMLGKQPDSDAPASGEPTFDNTVHYLATAARGFVSEEERQRVTARKAVTNK